MRLFRDGTLFFVPALFLLLLYYPVYGDAVYLDWLPSLPIESNYVLIGAVALSVAATIVCRGERQHVPHSKRRELPKLWSDWREAAIGLTLCSLFVCYYAITILWTIGESYALWKFLRLLIIIPFITFATAIYFNGRRHHIEILYILAIFAGVVLSLEAIRTFMIEDRGRSVYLGVNYIMHSRPLGIGALLCLYYMNTSRERWVNAVSIGIFGLSFIAMLQTGARGPLLALIGASVVYLGWVVWVSQVEITRRRLGIAALATGVAGALLSVVAGSTVSRMIRLFQWDNETSATGRVDMLFSSLQYWVEAPVFGHGIGSFPVLYQGVDTRIYPHNIILELAVEGGTIAAVLFLAFSGWCLLCAIRHRHRDPLLVGMTVALWTYLLANAMVTGDISTNRMLFVGNSLLLAVGHR